jgi:uncharacterized membrane protein YfcA
MGTVFLYILIVSFIATLVRSTFGFGESLVAVPLFSIVVPLGTAVPLSVLISVLVALVVVIQDHKQIHLYSAKWLILFSAPGIPIGIVILIYGNEFWIKIGLGILIISYALYAMLGKNKFHLDRDSRLLLFICGFLSGILGGAYGVNGPPLVVYGKIRKWTAKDFRATLQGYFLPASLIGIVGYVSRGLITLELLKYFMISLPAVIPAIFLGRFFNHRFKDGSFFGYAYLGLLFIGVSLIVYCILGAHFFK